MDKIYNISIFFSFIGLWITSMFSGDLEIILGFMFIFSFGILHGSNDILLIDAISNKKAQYPFVRVLLTYLVIIFSAVIIFYILPLLALLLFILFSAFHFGEQQWDYKNLKVSLILKNSYYFIYGLLVLQILFILNTEAVIEIIASISGYVINNNLFAYSLAVNLVLFIVLTTILFFKSLQFKAQLLVELFYLLVFIIIFKVSSLIWGFTIYFILWHSIPSLFEQIIFIYGKFTKANMLNYLKKAFPYWFVSIIGICMVYYVFKDQKLFYAIFFSFLAAITFPHAIVMNKMFKTKKTQSNK